MERAAKVKFTKLSKSIFLEMFSETENHFDDQYGPRVNSAINIQHIFKKAEANAA